MKTPEKLIIVNTHKLVWRNFTHFILSCTKGTISLDIYHNSPDKNVEIHAYISNLWVKEQYRRQGIATQLIRMAESKVKEYGISEVFLNWRPADSTLETLKWYERIGYEEIAFNDKESLMKKKL